MSLIRIVIIFISSFMASCSINTKLNNFIPVTDSSYPLCEKKDLYKNSSEMVNSILYKDSRFNPNCISPTHRKDREFLKELVRTNYYHSNKDIFNIADKSLRKNQAFITDVVVAYDENFYALAYADKDLRKNRAFMLKMLHITSYSLEYASDLLKKDKKFVWEAVKGNFGHSVLKNADTSIRKDKYFVLSMIGLTSGEALYYADASLKKDKDVVLAAVKTFPTAITWAHRSLQQDPNVIAVANAAKKEQTLIRQKMLKKALQRKK
jgi:hypothetical protein